MNNEQILNLTKEAMEKNEVNLLLEGEGKYACELDRFVPANMPTDIDRVVSEGIYKLYLENHDRVVLQKYKAAVLTMINGETAELWLAYHVCWSQLYNERRGESPFSFFDKALLENLRKNIYSKKEILKSSRIWQGENLEDGLWEDIQILEKSMYKFLGVRLL